MRQCCWRRQLDDKSRMTGDCHVRICEGLGVKFPRATRLCTPFPKASSCILKKISAITIYITYHSIVMRIMDKSKRYMKEIMQIMAVIVILFLFGCATQQPVQRVIQTQETAEAYLNRGATYSQKGEFDKAISNYNKAIELNPKFAVAYLDRGFTYSKLGEDDRAISDYNKAIEINPRYAMAFNNRGFTYRKKGDFDRAISDYNKAIEINPRYAVAYYNRGRAYYLKGEYDKSWEDVKKARDLGYKIPPKFLDDLRKASGRRN